MKWMRRRARAAGLAAAIGLLPVGMASAETRTIATAADENWSHSLSGISAPATIADMRRTAVQDYGTTEIDIAVQYGTRDLATIGTVFIFRPGGGSPSLWFDRARTAIETRDRFPNAASAPGRLSTFVPPSGRNESGLKIVYDRPGPEWRSTGLAVVPAGAWLAVIRLSSQTLDILALQHLLNTMIAATSWPKVVAEASAASPIEACAAPLTFDSATLVPQSGADKLSDALSPDIETGLLSAGIKDGRLGSAQPVYCREGAATADYSVYRPDRAEDRYVIALSDAGRVVSVKPQFRLDGHKAVITVSYMDLASRSLYQSFDRLPSPQQVFDLLNGSQPIATVTIGADGATSINLADPGTEDTKVTRP